MLFGLRGAEGQIQFSDPVILRMVDYYIDSVKTSDVQGVIILEIKDMKVYELDSDSVKNYSKVRELEVIIYNHRDQFMLRDVPPSLSFFHRNELIFLYSGVEILVYQDFDLIFSKKVNSYIKKLPNLGIFDTDTFFRARYELGEFVFQPNVTDVDPIILGNRWKSQLIDN